MDECVAYGAKTRVQVTRELFVVKRGASFERAMVGPGVVIVQAAEVFDIHAKPLLQKLRPAFRNERDGSGSQLCRQLFAQLGRRMERFRVGRKAAGPDIAAKVFGSAGNLGGEIDVLPSELRFVAHGEAHEIVENENLPVAIGTRANANGWDAELLGDASGKFARHGFQHHRKCAGGFDGSRVALELARSVSGFALNVEPAECVYGLRCEADMTHDWNFGFHQTRDQFDPAFAAFDLYGFRSAFFY